MPANRGSGSLLDGQVNVNPCPDCRAASENRFPRMLRNGVWSVVALKSPMNT